MAPILSKLKESESSLLNLIPSVVALFHPTFILVVDNLIRFIFLMMMMIMFPNLDKYLLRNPCIQVTMTPSKVIPVKIVLTLDLPLLTLGSPPLLPMFLLPSPITKRSLTHSQQ